jgi:hypothetical protein
MCKNHHHPSSGALQWMTIASVALGLAIPALAFAQGMRPVRNNGTGPVCIMQVGQHDRDPKDNWDAHLCVGPNETMQMSNGDFPPITFGVISGAGYYKADANSVVVIGSAFGGDFKFVENQGDWSISVDKVTWDHDGTLVAVEGLRPLLNKVFMKPVSGDKIAITSDVSHPRIANGNLYLTLEGRGKTEYWFKIKFGKITAIGKAGDKGEISK